MRNSIVPVENEVLNIFELLIFFQRQVLLENIMRKIKPLWELNNSHYIYDGKNSK